MRKRLLYLCLACSCVITKSIAQRLDAIGKEKPLSLSGGLNLSQIFYAVDGIESRRDPYTYFASGNLNVALYGWSIPLSFSISNQQTSFQQPFNQFSLHPSYKSLTAHIGLTSMTYSPYTVSGHLFNGAALDLAPEGRWTFSALYGRFLKAVPLDTAENSQPAFERRGLGFKSEYSNGKHSLNLILFRSKDELQSIATLPDSLGVLPEENLVLSLGGSKVLFDKWVLRAEWAGSALSKDVRSAKSYEDGFLKGSSFLFTSRISTAYFQAFKTGITYQQSAYNVGIAYEQIAPGYKTHGAYFFNNDLENITINLGAALLENKISLASSFGTQRDNLDNHKVSTMRRMVGSVNLNYTPSQVFNVSASYSSFQSFANIRSQFVDINQLTPYDNLDTLNFTQLSRNAALTTMLSIGKSETRKQSLTANLMYQNSADEQGGLAQNTGATFYNANAAYVLSMIPKNMSASLSVNATLNQSGMSDTKTLGPVLSLMQSFFDKKLRATLSTTYNSTYQEGRVVSNILNGRLGAALTLKKKHLLNVTMALVNRKNQAVQVSNSFTEFTGSLGYAYIFEAVK